MPTFAQWNLPFINAKKSLNRDDAAGIKQEKISFYQLQLTYYLNLKKKHKWKEVIIEKTAVKTCFADWQHHGNGKLLTTDALRVF